MRRGARPGSTFRPRCERGGRAAPGYPCRTPDGAGRGRYRWRNSSVSSSLSFEVRPGGRLHGVVRVPGDKSISHRFVMLASLADGVSNADGFLEGADALATVAAFKAMGVRIEGPREGRVRVHGQGLHGLQPPPGVLDLGNAGTAMRLMAGIMSGQRFASELSGDASLSSRPMRRVTEPLARMGARIEAGERGTPPLRIAPAGSGLRGVDYAMPMASAQVKSCLLLAGMYADGTTCVQEPAPTRDHTERMLRAFGVEVRSNAGRVCIDGGQRLRATDLSVPADISSAAFFMLGAAIAPDSDLTLESVGLNPTRTGVIDILRLMGADIEIRNERLLGAEPVADLRVRSSRLKGVDVPPALVPLAIDEFPSVFVAAACAEGETRVSGAAELRVKESDRIQVMADGLRNLGVDATPTDDGMLIRGAGGFTGGRVDSHGDHRIAMAFAMAGLRASGALRIDDCANVDTSFPGFVTLAARAGLGIGSGR
ncbi:MAG: 3-phosphoshikimate 1-carboxyvinyltransferase [Gammaproteobacteria bacterium]|nr:3-phosphoshikimate 1-carboxyvinyltransferase [Gammaproteobacteria bacterium]